MQEDYLRKIINSKEDLTGELGEQQKAYREFISGKWKTEEESKIAQVINFAPVNFDAVAEPTRISQITKLAADSNEATKYNSETYFYISDNDDFALKIDEKAAHEESSLTATIISEDGKDISNSLLYCTETNKYFLNNSENEIILTGFKNFEYRNFTFSLIQPAAKVFFVMPMGAGQFMALTLNKKYNALKNNFENGGLVIEFENTDNIKVVVLKSSKYYDFIPLYDKKVTIPKALTEPKFELLIY